MFDVAIPTDDGRWVSEGFERLARIVHDYDPDLELRWIPPEHRATAAERQKPYAIWDNKVNSLVFLASELDTPVDILERLFMGDLRKHNVLGNIEARNAAVRALEMKKKMDEAEERQEYAAWLIGTKKNFIHLPGGRKVDDQLRPIE